MSGAIPPLPQYVFMEWCLVKHRDNFIRRNDRELSGARLGVMLYVVLCVAMER
jgi:hypothetical protein